MGDPISDKDPKPDQDQTSEALAGDKKIDHSIGDAFGLMSHLGFSVLICVFLGIMGGQALDRYFGTSPTLLLLGAFLGMCASGKILYDLLIKKWME